MANYEKLSDSALELVSGGATRYVNTKTGQNAVLRSGPGIQFEQIESLPNRSKVFTTGEAVTNFEDGREWYEIYAPFHGWIAASLLDD